MVHPQEHFSALKRNEYLYTLLQSELQDTTLSEKSKVEKSAYRMLPTCNGGQAQNKLQIFPFQKEHERKESLIPSKCEI